jgi:tRNA/rRNA methyltransferase
MPVAFILMRPQLGENIGMVARAMWNFGLTDLRLVAPRDGWPNPFSGPAAAHADHILDAVQVFDSLEAAVFDCNRTVATAMRLPAMLKPVVTPAKAAEDAHALSQAGARTGFVFGPERTGLEAKEIGACDCLLTIPTAPGFGSLNVAMAATLVAHELFRLSDATPAEVLKARPGARRSRA